MRRAPALAFALAAALAAALGSGCAYAEARARDASQILRLQGGVALGFGVDTRLGGLLDLGFGAGYHWDGALLYGAPYAGKSLTIVAPGFCRRALGPTTVWSHTCPSALPPLLADEKIELADYTHLGSRLHEFDIEAAALAGVLHVRIGFSPGEFLDFLLGIATVDLAGDDGGQKPPPYKPPGAEPPRPAPAPAPAPAPPPRRPPSREPPPGEIVEPRAPPRGR